jgi:Virulence factor membrane-bound polymerase, C-terminal/O-Antigen ligase
VQAKIAAMLNYHCVILVVLISLPWMQPFALGPSSAMAPWLISIACTGSLGIITAIRCTRQSSQFRLNFYYAVFAIYFCIHLILSNADYENWSALIAGLSVLSMTYVGIDRFEDVDQALLFSKAWVLVALLSCSFALLQFLSFEYWLAPWISKSSDGSAYANLRQRNQFASLCGIGYICILYLRQISPLNNNRQLHQKIGLVWCYWIALTILAIGNGLSSSRTGAVQWVLILATVLLWRNSLRAGVRRLAYGGLGIYALVVAVMPWFAQWVGNSNTGLWGRAQEVAVAGVGRMALYSNVIDLIAMKPWFGWGWRELAYAHYSTHFDVRFVELLDNAHNLPLHLAVELGVPFAVLFCGAVLWWVVRSAPWRETDTARQLAWGILMLIGVHSMVEYPLWYGPFLMTLGICVGMLQRPKKDLNSAVVQAFITPIAIKFIAVALLCITAYLAFDYHRVSQIYLSEEDRSALYRDDVMGAAKRSVVFKKHAQFAELVTTPVTPQTAPHVLELALKLIHFSPEPRVIEPLIESATMLHFDDIAMFHLARYKAMYPKDYAAWRAQK